MTAIAQPVPGGTLRWLFDRRKVALRSVIGHECVVLQRLAQVGVPTIVRIGERITVTGMEGKYLVVRAPNGQTLRGTFANRLWLTEEARAKLGVDVTRFPIYGAAHGGILLSAMAEHEAEHEFLNVILHGGLTHGKHLPRMLKVTLASEKRPSVHWFRRKPDAEAHRTTPPVPAAAGV